jgi:outer membrane lipoprotein carrier protein
VIWIIGNSFCRRLLCGAIGALIGGVSIAGLAATATDNLNRFFEEFKTLQAEFSQVVLDENLVPLEESTGRLWISRPGRFRWNYHPPFAQQIVADGVRIWIYDIELEQVTVRDQRSMLEGTPALLLAGEGNLGTDYVIEDLGQQGPVAWVSLQPKMRNGGFAEVQLGFQNDTLRLIQLLDHLDQITRIVLSHVEENTHIPVNHFNFTVPVGVDLIEKEL